MAMWRRKRGRDVFRPYELQVLDRLRFALSPAAAELLDRQIAMIESVSRLYEDRESDLYPSRKDPQPRDPAIAFANHDDDLRLATVTLTGPRGTGKAVVSAVWGHIFQLSFTPSPKGLGDQRAIVAERVTLHVDPMIPDDGASALRRLDLLDPVIRAELESIWAQAGSESRLLSGPEELYTIDLDDGIYLVLTQLDDTSYLVAPVDPPGAGVRRYWPDGDSIRTYSTVREALATGA
jgi:hypothetical protein